MKALHAIRLSILTAAVTVMTSSFASAADEIQLWHSMTGPLGTKLNEIVKKFNAEHPDYKIVAVNKGSYPESMTAAIAAFRAGGQPHILQVSEAGTGTFMGAGKAVYPVYQLMSDQGKSFDTSAFIPAVTGYYSTVDGKMLSFPFNSSSIVTYYNIDAMQAAGVDTTTLPKTWDELMDVSRKIVSAGVKKCGVTTTWPSWLHVENFSAWHNIPMATKQNGMGGIDTEFTIDNPLVQRHWDNLVKWQKEGIYTYGGRGSTAIQSFASGDCAIMMGSSSSAASVDQSAQFNSRIGFMPYYGDVEGAPQNSIIGGASLWVMSGKPKKDYKGVAEFFEYLSKPEVQAEWAEFSGYLPITTSANALMTETGFYKEKPDFEVALKEVNLNPPTENSKGLRFGNYMQIRTIFDEELEQALNGSKSATQALKDAQRRGNAELRKFETTQKR